MMRMIQSSSTLKKNSILCCATLVAALALSACGGDSNGNNAGPPVSTGTVVYGVRGDAELVTFNPQTPGTVISVGNIGVGSGEQVVGLDFRPADGKLHAVTSTGRSLIIDPATALATAIQPITGTGTALAGTRVGVDFNPAANALRIIGDDGLNLRVPTAALVAPAPALPVNTLVDGRMGYLQGVTAAAYTNPNPGATGTALFVIDTQNDQLFTQDANVGRLTLVGPLDVDASAANGYDIVQVGADNEHYALLTVGTTTGLYSLNPTTGAATLITALPAGTYKGLSAEDDGVGVRGIYPLIENGTAYSISEYLLTVATGALTLADNFPLAGLPAGEQLIGLDVRTTSMELGLDIGYVVSRTGAIYTIGDDPSNPAQDLLTPVATISGATLAGTNFGVDFNPRADLLRIVSDTGQNLRVNLQANRLIAGADGVPMARPTGFAFVDGTTRLVSPAPQIVATAYRAAALNGTFQFALDARDSSLYRVAVPNDGALTRVGALGVTLPAVFEQSLDISGASDTTVLAALRAAGQARSTLYSVNLDTGAATSLGVIGTTGPVNAVTARVE